MITIDSRERLLCVYKLLVKTDQGVSVKDLQNYFRSVYGVAPDRKTLYGDLACIERHFPLKIKRDRIHNSRIMYSINPQSTAPLLYPFTQFHIACVQIHPLGAARGGGDIHTQT